MNMETVVWTARLPSASGARDTPESARHAGSRSEIWPGQRVSTELTADDGARKARRFERPARPGFISCRAVQRVHLRHVQCPLVSDRSGQSDGALRQNPRSQRDGARDDRRHDAIAGYLPNSGRRPYRAGRLQKIRLCRLGHAGDLHFRHGAGATDRQFSGTGNATGPDDIPAVRVQPFARHFQCRLVALDNHARAARGPGQVPRPRSHLRARRQLPRDDALGSLPLTPLSALAVRHPVRIERRGRRNQLEFSEEDSGGRASGKSGRIVAAGAVARDCPLRTVSQTASHDHGLVGRLRRTDGLHHRLPED